MIARLASLALIFAAAFSLSAAKQESIELKVDLDLLTPPVSGFTGGIGISQPKPLRTNKWLMVQCRYTPYSKTASATEYFDDVEMEVRVVFSPGTTVDGKQRIALYTGKVLFWTIRMDDIKREALMFLPGQLIDRAASTPDSSGISVASLKNFSAEVTFRHHGAVIGRAYRNAGSGNLATQEKRFQQMASRVSAGLIFDGALLSRGNSPWAGFYPDRYDAEKKSSPVMEKH